MGKDVRVELELYLDYERPAEVRDSSSTRTCSKNKPLIDLLREKNEQAKMREERRAEKR